MATPQRVFVAMPFNAKYDSVLDLIKKAAYQLNLEVVHVGEQAYVGSIISHIRSSIASSDVMVAIATEENGNVYYEIGLAHCQMKPVVLLTSDPGKLKFDLQDHRAIKYDSADPLSALPELTRLLSASLAPSPDLGVFLANAYSGVSKNAEEARAQGLKILLRTVGSELSLEPPLKLVSHTFRKETNDHAVEIEDFMGSRVRAIVDVNGVVRTMRRLEGLGGPVHVLA